MFGDSFVAVRRALDQSGFDSVSCIGLTKLLDRGAASAFLQELRESPPDLLWLTVPGKGASASRDQRLATAFAVLGQAMLDIGKDVVVEGHVKNHGWAQTALQPLLHDRRLSPSFVNWCRLPNLSEPGIARVTRLMSTKHVPAVFETCCGNARHIQLRRFPERTQMMYYKELCGVVCGVRAESDHSETALPVQSSTKKTTGTAPKSKAPKAQIPLSEDEPGEHAETRLLNRHIKKVPCEEHFDDCGDNAEFLELPPDD